MTAVFHLLPAVRPLAMIGDQISGLMRQAHVQGQGAQVIAFIASEQKRTDLIAELS